MKKIKKLTFCTIILGVFICCNKNNDEKYFNGEIRYFDESQKIVKYISPTVIPFDIFHGQIAVYDSLIICWNHKLPNYFFNVFNLDSGEEYGSFINKGRGPSDVSAVNPIYQFFKNGNDILTILYTYHGNHVLFWNISESIKKGESVFDKKKSINSNKDNSARYHHIFYQDDDTLLAMIRPIMISYEEAITPYYEKLTFFNNESLLSYPIYLKKIVRKGKSIISPEDFFYSTDYLKPDKSKIVQVMMNLPQINIIDTQTGEVIGYRMKNGPDFSLFETDMRSFKKYYFYVQADDNYIYTTTYWEENSHEQNNNNSLLSIIHVYDWFGKHIYELKCDREFFYIWLDPARNRLYSIDFGTDEVSYFSLNELNID